MSGYGFVVLAWLFFMGSSPGRPPLAFSSMEACEQARIALTKKSAQQYIARYTLCLRTGAKS